MNIANAWSPAGVTLTPRPGWLRASAASTIRTDGRNGWRSSPATVATMLGSRHSGIRTKPPTTTIAAIRVKIEAGKEGKE